MAQFFWTQLPLSCMADGYSRYRFQYFQSSAFSRTLRFDLLLRPVDEETYRHHAPLRDFLFFFARTICSTRVRATLGRLFDWNCASLFCWLFDAEGGGGVGLHGAAAGN